jgi:hypothetical protein
MILHDDKHLHIDEQDPIAEWFVRNMKSAQSGTINLDIGGQRTVKIDIVNTGDKIMVDLLEPANDETGLLTSLIKLKF